MQPMNNSEMLMMMNAAMHSKKQPLNEQSQQAEVKTAQNERKRKYSTGHSGASSRSSSPSFAADEAANVEMMSSRHESQKKPRHYHESDEDEGQLDYEYQDDNDMFSSQLLKLTSAAEQDGFSELQAFVIESDFGDAKAKSDEENFSRCFRPCMIYLPVKHRLSDTVSIRVKLKPVEFESKSTTTMTTGLGQATNANS